MRNPKSSLVHASIKRTALSLALGACVIGGVQAQTNTAGVVVGRATSGDTITVANPATGFTRTLTVGSDGSYRFSALPTGQYTVTRKLVDGTSSTRNVTVNVGTSSSVDFVAAGGGATTLDAVTVTGSSFINPIDVSSVESTTILTSEQIAKIPVPRDVTSVALLAPGTVRGDAAFGNMASFGGSSVAENQFFINGFNITNSFKNLNFAQIPYEGVAEQQIKTGGYGAEFGRSTGGVVNLITKRGSNEFKAGGNIFWSPKSLSETNPNLYYNDGQLVSDNSKDNGWAATSAVWASGALVKDKLFAYALLQYGRERIESYPGSATGVGFGGSNFSNEIKSPKWLVKLDWNINDSNILEFTGFSDRSKNEIAYYRTQFGTAASPSAKPLRSEYQGTEYIEEGGENYVLKYTGYLTDSFTLSVLAGQGKTKRSDYAVTAGGVREAFAGNLFGDVPGCPRVIDSRPQAVQQATGTIVGCNFIGAIFGGPNNEDKRDQYRIDAEWQLGDHVLRGGVDIDNFETTDSNADEGGVRYQYAQSGGRDFVRRTYFRNAATVEVNQRAFYIEDTWSITDNFNAYLGLRWDTFDNKNGMGQTFAKIDNQFAPRLGFSWDVNGDSTFKIFGNAGRYALPLTANVAIRGASASRYEIQDFVYTGIDPTTKAPIGLGDCSFCSYPDQFFANNEFGVAKDPNAIVSQNLEPMYQDEYILGFQAQLTDNLSGGVRAIYRDLKRAIDDTCDYRPIQEYAEENGLEFNPYNPGFAFCHLYNPGSDGIFNVDVDGDGTFERITIPADVLGPKAKRTYSAIEFFFEGVWDKFFLQGSYTYSKSKGNTEGGVKSDIGQADTGTTQDFDYPELTYGSFGYLPNDRRHSLKLFGNYEINDQWSVGANLLVQSGRPVNCIGIYGNDPVHYRNSYFSCDSGNPADNVDPTHPGNANNGTTIVPRGTAGRLPWSTTLDLNVSYAPAFADGKLKFKVDVFNVLNSDKATSINEFGETSTGSPQDAALTYRTPTSWQQPRFVRLMVQYDF